MEQFLDMERLPVFNCSAFRFFEKGEHHVSRIFDYEVLLLVFEGTLRFHEAGRSVEVNAGEYYIQKSGLAQEGILESDLPRYYYIHFSGDFTDNASGLSTSGRFDTAQLMPLFNRLETLNKSAGSLIQKSAVFYDILTRLHSAKAPTYEETLVQRVISYISEKEGSNITLNALCKECGYSKNHIISIFKKHTGLTPFSYLNVYRISKAKQLILSSEKSLAEIALLCGYESYVNFYKAFKAYEKMPPLKWAAKQGLRKPKQ